MSSGTPVDAETGPGEPEEAAPLSAEDAEWVAELGRSWVEVYKKSATTLVLLRIVRDHGPVAAGEAAERFTEASGWSISERGLYRTLRRLAQSGLLTTAQVEVPRTGAKRQDFRLTPAGRIYLRRIEAELIA